MISSWHSINIYHSPLFLSIVSCLIGSPNGKFNLFSKSDGKFETSFGKGILDLIFGSLFFIWLLLFVLIFYVYINDVLQRWFRQGGKGVLVMNGGRASSAKETRLLELRIEQGMQSLMILTLSYFILFYEVNFLHLLLLLSTYVLQLHFENAIFFPFGLKSMEDRSYSFKALCCVDIFDCG